ncbi:hypothetical protein CSUI_006975, partial [Cystoisospora suis]
EDRQKKKTKERVQKKKKVCLENTHGVDLVLLKGYLVSSLSFSLLSSFLSRSCFAKSLACKLRFSFFFHRKVSSLSFALLFSFFHPPLSVGYLLSSPSLFSLFSFLSSSLRRLPSCQEGTEERRFAMCISSSSSL